MFDVLMGAGWLCVLLFLVSLFTRRTAFFFKEKTKKKALLTWGILVFVFFGTVGVFYSDELNAVSEERQARLAAEAEEKRAAEVEKATLEAHKQAEAEARKKAEAEAKAAQQAAEAQKKAAAEAAQQAAEAKKFAEEKAAAQANAGMTKEEAQQKVAAYLQQLDTMCGMRKFIETGFAQDPGKSWKEGLEALEAELKASDLPLSTKNSPRLLIHLGLQTVFKKGCLPPDDWDRKNVNDELGQYAR